MPQPEIDWNKIDWDDLYPRLLVFAAGKLRRLTWRGTRSGSVPEGRDAKDFVHQAIEKTMDGTRVWDVANNSIFKHLAWIISSEINHFAETLENKSTIRADDKVINISDHIGKSPEEHALRASEERHFLEYLESKKRDLRRLAEIILYSCIRNTAEISVVLNLSISETESLKRNLRRATEEYQNKQESNRVGNGGTSNASKQK